MGELSDRFAELMARMAKSDAELFRTIGEQNASVRQMVDDLVPMPEATPVEASSPTLAAGSLLPTEQCSQQGLKLRFSKIAEAQAWIESQIGPAPKKLSTWAAVEKTIRNGSWAAPAKKAAAASKGINPEQLEERLATLEAKLTQRFDRLESLLLLLAESSERQGLPAGNQPAPMA
jgi:hypothetical protein